MVDSVVLKFVKNRIDKNGKDVIKYLDIIVGILKSGKCGNSQKFLESVIGHMEKTMSISKKQMQVIDDIKKMTD